MQTQRPVGPGKEAQAAHQARVRHRNHEGDDGQRLSDKPQLDVSPSSHTKLLHRWEIFWAVWENIAGWPNSEGGGASWLSEKQSIMNLHKNPKSMSVTITFWGVGSDEKKPSLRRHSLWGRTPQIEKKIQTVKIMCSHFSNLLKSVEAPSK